MFVVYNSTNLLLQEEGRRPATGRMKVSFDVIITARDGQLLLPLYGIGVPFTCA
jgi:hypothetical protein